MEPTGTSPRLVFAFVLSCLLHALLGALIVGTPRTARAIADRLDISFEDASPPEPETQVTLGEPDSTATTITWIGYTEYTERHAGSPADTDQAAATLAQPLPPATEPSEQQAQPVEALAQKTPQPVPEPPAEAPEQEQPTDGEAVVLVQQPLDAAQAKRALQEAGDLFGATLDAAADGMADIVRTIDGISRPFLIAARDAGPPTPPTQDEATPIDQPQQEPTEVADATGEPAPAAADSPPTPMPDPGILSDRESIATAIENAREVNDWTRPLAGKGLRISTVRPRMAISTEMLTRGRRDQVVRVWFGPEGTVKRIQVLRSSGYRVVDQAVIDAVYQWKAEGEQVGGTKPRRPEATVWLDFRIVL